MKSIALVMIILSSAINSCSSSKESQLKDEKKETVADKIISPVPIPVPAPISPGSAKIAATVVSIEPVSASEDKNEPCGKVSCFAFIRIDKVIGYGQGFESGFTVGQEVKVKFAFTTGNTKELFKDLATGYPGLKVGSVFKATIQNTSGKSKSTIVPFTIYDYEL